MVAELLVMKFLQVSNFHWGPPCVVAELLVVKFLQVFDPVDTVALPIFICIQMQLLLALV